MDESQLQTMCSYLRRIAEALEAIASIQYANGEADGDLVVSAFSALEFRKFFPTQEEMK